MLIRHRQSVGASLGAGDVARRAVRRRAARSPVRTRSRHCPRRSLRGRAPRSRSTTAAGSTADSTLTRTGRRPSTSAAGPAPPADPAPSSTVDMTTCRWPCGCMWPPITPNGPTGRPPWVRKPGMIVWNGRLPPATTFGCPGIERESGASVLQAEAVAREHDVRTEAHVVGLDQADHHAVGVGRAQVDGAAPSRVAGRRHRRAVSVMQARGARPGSPGPAARRPGPERSPGRRRTRARRRSRASSPRSAVHRCSAGVAGEVEAVEDAERDQRGDALAVRRDLPDVVAAVAGTDRIDPGRRVRSARSSSGDQAAGGGRVRGQRLRDLAGIERLGAAVAAIKARVRAAPALTNRSPAARARPSRV